MMSAIVEWRIEFVARYEQTSTMIKLAIAGWGGIRWPFVNNRRAKRCNAAKLTASTASAMSVTGIFPTEHLLCSNFFLFRAGAERTWSIKVQCWAVCLSSSRAWKKVFIWVQTSYCDTFMPVHCSEGARGVWELQSSGRSLDMDHEWATAKLPAKLVLLLTTPSKFFQQFFTSLRLKFM